MVLSQNKIEARKRLKYTVSLFAGSIDITRVFGLVKSRVREC